MSWRPLTDVELVFGSTESPQAADALKEAYRELRTAYEQQRKLLAVPAFREASSILAGGQMIAWLQRHLQTCRDASCTGCKLCRCGALTLAYGFEDHLCYNCRNPPSD